MPERLVEHFPDAYAAPEQASSLCEVSVAAYRDLRGAATTIDLT
jgi:hypothetical protein